MVATKTRTKWEKTARGARLVRSEVLGSMTKTKRGANWKRADGAAGSERTQRAARAAVMGESEPKAKAKAKMKTLPLTPSNLYAEAAKIGPEGRFHSQVFLAPLLARFGSTPQASRDALLAMHRAGEIVLTRADLVDAMNPAMVRNSEIRAGVSYAFHLLAPRDY